MARMTIISYCHQNHGVWIPHWIQQLQKQTTQNFDVVFVFHNWRGTSAMSGPAIALKEAFGDRLRFFDHCGPPVIGDVIDFAISKANTEYIAHFDLDDIMHPDRLKLQSEFIRQNPNIDAINSRCVGFIGENPDISNLYARDTSSPLLTYLDDPNLQTHDQIRKCFDKGLNCLSHSAMIYKRDIIPKLGGFSRSDVKIDGKSPDFETWRKMMNAGFFFSPTARTIGVLEA